MDGGEQVQHIEKEAVKKLKRWLTNVGNVPGCFFVLHILFSRQLNKFN